jgi:hypothetical protein
MKRFWLGLLMASLAASAGVARALPPEPTPDPASLRGADSYLNDALNSAMTGKPVAVAVTKPYGCAVHYGE